MSFLRVAGLGLVACVLASSRSDAQSAQRWSLQGSASVLIASADDPVFESATRVGYEGQLRYTFSRFSLGAGYQRATVYAIEDPSGEATFAFSIGFLEPRYVVTAGGAAALYLAGRLGVGTLVCSIACEVEGANLAYGGGGGVLLRLSRRLSADFGAQYFGVSDETFSGYTTLRAGLSFGL